MLSVVIEVSNPLIITVRLRIRSLSIELIFLRNTFFVLFDLFLFLEVGHQPVDVPEGMAGGDHEVGVGGEGGPLQRLRQRFEGPAGGGPHRDDPPPRGPHRLDGVADVHVDRHVVPAGASP